MYTTTNYQRFNVLAWMVLAFMAGSIYQTHVLTQKIKRAFHVE